MKTHTLSTSLLIILDKMNSTQPVDVLNFINFSPNNSLELDNLKNMKMIFWVNLIVFAS